MAFLKKNVLMVLLFVCCVPQLLFIVVMQVITGANIHLDSINAITQKVIEQNETGNGNLGPNNIDNRTPILFVSKSNVEQLKENTTTIFDNYSKSDKIPHWQIRLKHPDANDLHHYFLAEVLQVRIYAGDRAKWSLAELKQWMHYMFWAGAEHIYLCDHNKYKHEKLDVPLKQYIDLGLLTYIPKHMPREAMAAQVECYQYVIDTYRRSTTWQIAVDMDEYPYVSKDLEEGFLIRYLKQQADDISELSMHNYLLLGQGDRTRTMAIERINRITPHPINNLDKPIYRPQRVFAQIHHNTIRDGRVVEVDGASIMMLHYWGARLQKWGPDTKKTLSSTIEFNVIRDQLAPKIRNSLITFGELHAFNATTGP